MGHRDHRRASWGTLSFLLVAIAILSSGTAAWPGAGGDTLTFAADMAKRGNWREALYRWERIAREKPGNSRILNNLAVAHEALGEPEIAYDYYARAVELSPDDERIEANQLRFERFWSRIFELNGDGETEERSATHTAQPAADPGKGKGKTSRVTVELPVPPRLDTSGFRTVLVAKFLADQTELVDVPNEMVRFMRSKLRKDPDLELLSVVPAPEVPEQTLEDLVSNGEFWKYLGREYGADLIVSGMVKYDQQDHSGFEDVDRVDPTTGQKVRESEFVEQEQFTYTVDLIFMGGASGDPVYQDRMQRSSVYRGNNNDPVTAFHDLSDSLAADVMAIVEPRTREDDRFIFKK